MPHVLLLGWDVLDACSVPTAVCLLQPISRNDLPSRMFLLSRGEGPSCANLIVNQKVL
jgi:hypothetical protein